MDKFISSNTDFSTIERFLEAINQTTDDYLFAFDIKMGKFRFFGSIDNVFEIENNNTHECTFEELLSIVHPADKKMLSSDIEAVCSGQKDSHDMDFRMFNRNDETVWVNSRAKVLHDDKGNPNIMIGRVSEEAVRHLFNPLTGLWNKTKLREDLKNKLNFGKGYLMMLGIPSLSDINLIHGRNFGNHILREMADLLEELDCVEESYHIDQNNFAVITNECEPEDVKKTYDQICNRMNEKCTVFAGIVPIDNTIFIDISQLLDSVNITLRSAEENSTGEAEFFSSEEIGKRITELTLLEELRESTQNGFEGFEVFYQPQIKSKCYEIYGIEALLRYNSPKRGRIFPDEFIPLLEQSGLINQVGMWVLSEALEQCKKWRNNIPNLQVAVNFSSVQFEDPRLGDKIIDALKAASLPGNALTVELTESVQLNESDNFFNILKNVKAYGVRFSIDDFGTGYSNLGYLKQLDVSEIKIDRSFISEIEKNTYNYRLISNLIEFAKINAIDTCCEGVETTKALSIIEPLQADFFQGYLFDKPCTANEIERKYIDDTSNEYKARIKAIDEIQRYKEQYGAVHFDPANILSENNIGLWIIRIDRKNDRHELHADNIMERVLGLTQSLSPVDCYDYWYSRISDEYLEYVNNAVSIMVNNEKAVQLKYTWNHPSLGPVTVSCSGIRTKISNNVITLEGYHRILTGVDRI